MKKFEVGKVYRSNDYRLDPLRIVKRTARTVIVKNASYPGGMWRLFLHEDAEKDTEYIVECHIGDKWRRDFTYRADLEVDWGAG